MPQVPLMPHRASRLPPLFVALAFSSLAPACAATHGAELHFRDGVSLAQRALEPVAGAKDGQADERELLRRARLELEEALRLTPRLEGAPTTLAAVLLALGEDEAAGRQLADARPEAPDERRIVAQLGALLAARRGDWAGARTLLEAQLGQAGPGAEPDVALEGMLGLALAAQHELLPPDPLPCPPPPADSTSGASAPCPAELTRRLALDHLGRAPDPALAMLTQALSLRGETAPPAAPSGSLQAPAAANARFSQALPLFLRARAGESPDALLAALEALPAAPEGGASTKLEVALDRLRASLLSRLGRWPEVLAALDAALTRLDASPEVPGRALLQAELGTDRALALAWLHAPRVDEARRALAEVLASQPEHARARSLDALLAR